MTCSTRRKSAWLAIPAIATYAFVAGAICGSTLPAQAHDYGLRDASDYYPPPAPYDLPRTHHERHERLDFIVVDCSRSHRDRAWSVQDAIDRVAPNGKIMIMPPGEGMTCRESLSIDKPVTISTFGGGQSAVIQAPDSRSCVEANVPLGDSLVFDGITFIARGRSAPCIRVRAGHVVVRNSTIDSRNTDWAFDVLDSGTLGVENTKIATDGSGVHALRAEVHLKGVEIDVSPARRKPALVLDRTDGDVEGGEIIGGRWGVVASSGPHGLSLTDLKVRDANTAIELIPGSQGTIRANKLSLSDNRTGFVVAPYVDADISDNIIADSEDDGMVLYETNARVENNRIAGGKIGIRLAITGGEIAGDFWGDLDPRTYRPGDDPPRRGVPEITGNFIADVGQADIVDDDGARASIIGNQLYARPGCVCIASHRGTLFAHANDCRNSSEHWPGRE